MLLKELLEDIKHTCKSTNYSKINIKEIRSDSRKVRKGDLFVAVRGFNEDGNRFLDAAIEQGAAAILSDLPTDKRFSVPFVLVQDARKSLSRIAANYYGHPSKKMHIVGITGTNGKTTTSYLLEAILRGQGYKTGVIGTIRYKIMDRSYDAPNTTPDSLALQGLLAQMCKAGVEWVVMEVSSHALELHRVDDCAFDQAIFTNLTEDHFDFHGNFENYFQAKKKLFTLLAKSPKPGKFAVINIDDAYGKRLVREIRGVPCHSVSVKSESSYRAQKISLGINETCFSINGLEVETGLSGQFNVYNTLGAFAWASELRLKKMIVLQTLAHFKSVEGRFEVFSAEKCPSVVVDYAHTDDALENVLKTISDIKKGKVITVFGCGGNRDKLKRPKMGKVADRLSDIVIVTSDNPRKEDPQAIIEDVLHGIRRKKNLYVEVDRLKAIKKAFSLARKEDVILVAGKGHEDYQIFKDRTIHFSDREIVRKILSGRKR